MRWLAYAFIAAPFVVSALYVLGLWKPYRDRHTGKSLDELVTEWHNLGDGDDTPLNEYLGMTLEECNAWAADHRNVPERLKHTEGEGE